MIDSWSVWWSMATQREIILDESSLIREVGKAVQIREQTTNLLISLLFSRTNTEGTPSSSDSFFESERTKIWGRRLLTNCSGCRHIVSYLKRRNGNICPTLTNLQEQMHFHLPCCLVLFLGCPRQKRSEHKVTSQWPGPRDWKVLRHQWYCPIRTIQVSLHVRWSTEQNHKRRNLCLMPIKESTGFYPKENTNGPHGILI